MRTIAAAVGVGKYSASRIINQQKNFAAVYPKRKSNGHKQGPGNSPDINPIENLWNIVKRHVNKMDCSTKKTMIENDVKVCFRDDEIKILCSNLVESISNRVRDLIQARVGHILH
ncbi:uncharacterized protein TNCV_4088411 [Trichonephila clavipes]|nr:uncharacterized protein TNCV_4088411 [Trichonephila clavipes]